MFMREKRKICGKCGTHSEEWRRDPYAFVGDLEICPGCEVLEQTQEEIPDKAKGVKTVLVPRELFEMKLEAELAAEAQEET